MYKDKKILAIIPARGGSKGIKNKNLKKIKKKSLVCRAIEFCKNQKQIDHIIVSTDSLKIKNETEKNGIKVPFLRPKKLSGDKISDYDVLIDTLKKSEIFFNTHFDLITMLQPTSPQRTTKEFLNCLKKINNKKIDAIWTVNKVDKKFHPLKQLIKNNKSFSFFDKKGEKIIRRQQLKHTFIRNGAVYIFTRNCLVKHKNIYGKKLDLLISKINHISIDTYSDLSKVQKLITK